VTAVVSIKSAHEEFVVLTSYSSFAILACQGWLLVEEGMPLSIAAALHQ
jgi:hypothetical protein